MFPTGLPGFALGLLRASVALAFLMEGYSHRAVLPGWAQAAAILLCVALVAGYLTPIVAVVVLCLHGLIWSFLGADSAAGVALVSLDALALALLGAGAYSLDCYLFGRRVVVLLPG